MSITINPPAGPWTIDDLADLPDTGGRVEIHEGNLVLMSPASVRHTRVMNRVAAALRAQSLPTDVEVGVKRSPRNFRIADVAVFHQPQQYSEQAFWDPADLAIVVEVVSESSEEDDRVTKPRWYAEVGIPAYWRVERSAESPSDAVIFQYELATTADGASAYVQTGVTTLAALEAGQGSNL